MARRADRKGLMAGGRRADARQAELWAQAAALGVPRFLVRLVGVERLKRLPPGDRLRHRCD